MLLHQGRKARRATNRRRIVLRGLCDLDVKCRSLRRLALLYLLSVWLPAIAGPRSQSVATISRCALPRVHPLDESISGSTHSGSLAACSRKRAQSGPTRSRSTSNPTGPEACGYGKRGRVARAPNSSEFLEDQGGVLSAET
jgi:hypothetical protein